MSTEDQRQQNNSGEKSINQRSALAKSFRKMIREKEKKIIKPSKESSFPSFMKSIQKIIAAEMSRPKGEKSNAHV